MELLGHMVTLFNLLRNYQMIFQCGCTILHSHQQCMRVPITPHPHQYLLFSMFFLKIYLFLATLGLHCCARAFSSCGKRELLLVAVHGLLIAVASLVAEHKFQVHRLQ